MVITRRPSDDDYLHEGVNADPICVFSPTFWVVALGTAVHVGCSLMKILLEPAHFLLSQRHRKFLSHDTLTQSVSIGVTHMILKVAFLLLAFFLPGCHYLFPAPSSNARSL